jgi:hypothetical protein
MEASRVPVADVGRELTTKTPRHKEGEEVRDSVRLEAELRFLTSDIWLLASDFV